MTFLHSATMRYVLVIALAATIGGAAYAVSDRIADERAKPVSVMGPGYNPPPPHIPIS